MFKEILQWLTGNVPNINHLVFVRFSTRKTPCISSGSLCLVSCLKGISSRTQVITPLTHTHTHTYTHTHTHTPFFRTKITFSLKFGKHKIFTCK